MPYAYGRTKFAVSLLLATHEIALGDNADEQWLACPFLGSEGVLFDARLADENGSGIMDIGTPSPLTGAEDTVLVWVQSLRGPTAQLWLKDYQPYDQQRLRKIKLKPEDYGRSLTELATQHPFIEPGPPQPGKVWIEP